MSEPTEPLRPTEPLKPTAPAEPAPRTEATLVREYGGTTPEEAAAAYQQDATAALAAGYEVAAIAWSPQRTLVVTYQARGATPPTLAGPAGWTPPPGPVVGPDRWCTRCGRYQSPAWVDRCSHCGARYAEFPPASTPPPPGTPLAAPGISRSTVIVLVVAVAAALLLGLVLLLTIGLLASLPTY